uniref:Uncharacterized protein n=1 Tax=Pithovirus LCPAC102 TaxID=2506587 RepID=A0A481Z2U7_9VIRU|nr:MAG: hypothetical protein LCPAC102_00370 [Pithovirus LCPAC102]
MIKYLFFFNLIILFIYANETTISWSEISYTIDSDINQINTYDYIIDYINQLTYIVYIKNNSLYSVKYYYKLNKIIVTDLQVDYHIKYTRNIKLTYNPLIYNNNITKFNPLVYNITKFNLLAYNNNTKYNPAMLVIQGKNNIDSNETLYVFLCDNFGINKKLTDYNWNYSSNITLDSSDKEYQISHDSGVYNYNTSWIICYTQNTNSTYDEIIIDCRISINGIYWNIPSFDFININCTNIEIITGREFEWFIYCYNEIDNIYNHLGYIYNGIDIITDHIYISGINFYNIAKTKKKDLHMNTNIFGYFVLIDNYTIGYTNNIMYNTVDTSSINKTSNVIDIIPALEINGWYILIDNILYSTINGTVLTPIITLNTNKYISKIETDYHGNIILFSDDMYISIINITLLNKTKWIFRDMVEIIDIQIDLNKNQVIIGDIKFTNNITIISNISILIDGNLDLNENLVLNNTDTIEITGNLNIMGNLILNNYFNNDSEQTEIILFRFNSSNNEKFNDTYIDGEKLACNEKLIYAKTSISIIFDSHKKCDDDSIDYLLYIIIIIIGSLVLISIIISGIILIVFRRQLFPYRDIKYNSNIDTNTT